MKRLHLKRNTDPLQLQTKKTLAGQTRNCLLGSDKHFMSYGSGMKLNLDAMLSVARRSRQTYGVFLTTKQKREFQNRISYHFTGEREPELQISANSVKALD